MHEAVFLSIVIPWVAFEIESEVRTLLLENFQKVDGSTAIAADLNFWVFDIAEFFLADRVHQNKFPNHFRLDNGDLILQVRRRVINHHVRLI